MAGDEELNDGVEVDGEATALPPEPAGELTVSSASDKREGAVEPADEDAANEARGQEHKGSQPLVALGGLVGVWLGMLVSYALYHLFDGVLPVQVTTFVLVAGCAFLIMGSIPRLGRRAPVFIGVSLGLLIALTLVAVVMRASL